MSFLLRAAIVIAALSYYAARDRPGSPAGVDVDVAGASLAVWNALPPEARERVAREGAAELARGLAGQAMAAAASRDTLAEADRRPAWRGKPTP